MEMISTWSKYWPDDYPMRCLWYCGTTPIFYDTPTHVVSSIPAIPVIQPIVSYTSRVDSVL